MTLSPMLGFVAASCLQLAQINEIVNKKANSFW
jgi:hypothetical protein